MTLANADTELDEVAEPLSFYQNVSPSKELRDASNEAESTVRNFGVESSMRLDVYHAKVEAEKNIKASGQWDKLSAEEKRLIEKMVCGHISSKNTSIIHLQLMLIRSWMVLVLVWLCRRRSAQNLRRSRRNCRKSVWNSAYVASRIQNCSFD